MIEGVSKSKMKKQKKKKKKKKWWRRKRLLWPGCKGGLPGRMSRLKSIKKGEEGGRKSMSFRIEKNEEFRGRVKSEGDW